MAIPIVAPRAEEPRAPVLVPSTEHALRVFRARVAELGITHEKLDEIAGWAPGYASKVLAIEPMKELGPKSLWIIAEALGLELALFVDPDAMRRIQNRLTKRKHRRAIRSAANQKPITVRVTAEFMRKIGAKGGETRARKMTKSAMRKAGRKAARARWKRPRVSRASGRPAKASPPSQVSVPPRRSVATAGQ